MSRQHLKTSTSISINSEARAFRLVPADRTTSSRAKCFCTTPEDSLWKPPPLDPQTKDSKIGSGTFGKKADNVRKKCFPRSASWTSLAWLWLRRGNSFHASDSVAFEEKAHSHLVGDHLPTSKSSNRTNFAKSAAHVIQHFHKRSLQPFTGSLVLLSSS